ncbi:MAG: sigma-70 family RNA polymerase sigma factor [Chitinophagales bacterium]|nr:sigma-70 family RNA polymerase sigma factor [Chitinophagales bacterium]
MKQLKINTRITSRDSVSVDKYLNEISKLSLLNEEQEVALAKRVRQGDAKALNDLIKANLRFVVSVAKQYQSQGLSLNDLINEGNIGLIKAASKFDETKGFKFISYAVWWIRQSILQALIEQPRVVRLPMNKATFYNKILVASQEFEQKNEREPSNMELAEILNVDATDLAFLRSTLAYHLSIDSPLDNNSDEDSSTTNLDLMQDYNVENPDDELMKQSMRHEIENALHQLTDREREILELYFGINNNKLAYSLDEIGSKLSLTRERVRQLKDKALRKIKRHAKNNSLNVYL